MKMGLTATKLNAGRSGLTFWTHPLTKRSGRSGNYRSCMKFMDKWEHVGVWFKNT
jgi:hypothetical protein